MVQGKNKKNLFSHISEIIEAGDDPKSHEPHIWQEYGHRVAVMVLDSTGFSRVSDSHGILHFLSRLVVLRELVAPILKEAGAVTYKFEADNVFAAFESPDIALTVAERIHRAVDDHGLMLTDDEPFRVCIGIGYGDLLYSETLEGFFGEEMNLASKLGEDTAEGGETLLTARAHATIDPAVRAPFDERRLVIAGLDVPYFGCRHIKP